MPTSDSAIATELTYIVGFLASGKRIVNDLETPSGFGDGLSPVFTSVVPSPALTICKFL